MAKPFNYGGQAIIEGVMMRGSRKMCLAVRAESGEIVLHCEDLNSKIYNSIISRLPFLRGLTMLWDSLGLGIRALMFSADVAVGEEDADFSGPVAWGTVAFSFIIGIAIFFVAPLLLVQLVDPMIASSFVSNVIEGLIRLAFFLIYIWAIGLMPEITRVFGYHGSEHKTINAYEAGDPLTVEAVARHSTSHVRCGTAFLLQVVVISIFVFALLGRPPLVWRIVSRIALIPVIAGIAYEFLKFSAAHKDNRFMWWLIQPGLWLQSLTTREPDESMLEVGIAALKQLLKVEQIETASEELPERGTVSPVAAPVTDS
jgi:uncharacterized protein YqhQ